MSREPRVLVYSQRGIDGLLCRCVTYEFEDLIGSIDDVSLITSEAQGDLKWRRRFADHTSRFLPLVPNLGLTRNTVDREYDLFFAVVSFRNDLPTLQSVQGWRERSRCAVCVIEEIWPIQLKHFRGYAKLLSQFDHVILNCLHTVPAMESVIDTPVHQMPPGVDALRFCPYPNPAPRSVHVYSMGRRSEVTHRAIQDFCHDRGLWYIHDTISTQGPKATNDPKSHRRLLAETAKRSHFFVANAGKIDRRCETAGNMEVGPRFFEGAASGTIMFGQPPESDLFESLFNWPDAVLRLEFDSTDVTSLFNEINGQPERISRIRTDNVVNSLLRFDWLYRWKKVLDLAGMQPTEAFLDRERKLHAMADELKANPLPAF